MGCALPRRLGLAATSSLTAFALAGFALAQGAPHNGYRTPSSSMEHAADIGVAVHTNLLIMLAPADTAAHGATPAQVGPPVAGYFYETPASLACLYKLVAASGSACNPNDVFTNPNGGTGTIAVIDAYDDPHAAADLSLFSAQFGLPAGNFSVVYASGRRPSQDPTGGWELEESLDIEYAHAMAPRARLILVEAASDTNADLYGAVQVANGLVAQNGGGEVSMSWGGSEFSTETSYDRYFQTPHVIYLAAAGDAPGAQYPATSPYVIAAGGSSTNRDPFTGAFEVESAWQSSGGGPSAYEPAPVWQHTPAGELGFSTRSTPDLALDADPNTGVWAYDSNQYEGEPGGWFILGGTSVSAQALAGIVNSAHSGAASGTAELTLLYGGLGNGVIFRDITVANCGFYGGFLALPGWDYCTGIGSVLGYNGK